MDALAAQALTATVEERIGMLRRQRQLHRRSPYRAEWSLSRMECETELRALLRLRRHARRIARAATSDRIYHELGYHDAQAVPV